MHTQKTSRQKGQNIPIFEHRNLGELVRTNGRDVRVRNIPLKMFSGEIEHKKKTVNIPLLTYYVTHSFCQQKTYRHASLSFDTSDMLTAFGITFVIIIPLQLVSSFRRLFLLQSGSKKRKKKEEACTDESDVAHIKAFIELTKVIFLNLRKTICIAENHVLSKKKRIKGS